MLTRFSQLIGALLLSLSGRAQFNGINSFQSETMFQEMIKSKGVRCVNELVATDTYTYDGGQLCFDTAGRVVRRFKDGKLLLMEHGRWGLITKSTFYNEKDSTQIDYWQSVTYDDKGHELKRETGNYRDGKLTISRESQAQVLEDKKGKFRMLTNKYYGDKIHETEYSVDSTSGIYDFNITYTFEPDDTDEKGRKSGNKTLSRYYEKDLCGYQDRLKYKVYGRLETLDEIETWYYQRDKKGRLLEYGRIDYENAFMQYAEEHPEEFSMYALPPGLGEALLSGKLKGERTPMSSSTFDAKGRLIAKNDGIGNYKFTYNEKGQLIEQVSEGYSNSVCIFTYNEKGLISKTTTTYWNRDQEPTQKRTEVCTYTYTYY